MRKVSAIVLVSALLAACGGSSSEFTSGGPIALDQLPDKLSVALCKAEQDCSPFFYGIAFANRDCKTTLADQLREATFTQIQVRVDAKRIIYDGDKAQSCLAAVTTGSCSVLDNHLPEVCREALTGTIAVGGNCDIDDECSGHSHCLVTAGACPGKCEPVVTAGVTCAADSDCDVGLTCSKVTLHCAVPAAVGEPCQGGSGAECAAGLLCVGSDDGQKRPGSCQPFEQAVTGKVGEACDLQDGPWCVAGAACVLDSTTPTVATCHAVAKAGGSCGFGIPSECPAGQYCPLQLTDLALGKLTATCAALPTSGESCAPAVGFARCAGSLVCDESTTPLKPTCIALRSLGQSCANDDLCKSQHCVGSVCVPDSVCAK